MIPENKHSEPHKKPMKVVSQKNKVVNYLYLVLNLYYLKLFY